MVWVLGIVSSSIALAFSALMHFHSVNVDISFLQEHAGHIEWLDPASYFNGFHPILLPVLIKLSGIDHWPLLGLVLSNLLYGASVALLYKLLLHRLQQTQWALVLTVLCASLPQFFEVFVSPMQDALLVFFVLLSALKWQENKPGASGMWMALAALSRGHGLFIALLFFLFWIGPRFREFKQWRKWLLALVLVYSPQLLVNWSATGNPFANHQTFNIYQHFYLGMFPSSADLEVPTSLWAIIQMDPGHFWTVYKSLLLKNGLWLFIGLLALVAGIVRKDKWLLRIALLLQAYFLVAILGNSSRLYAPVIFFVALAVSGLVQGFHVNRKTILWPGIALGLGILHFSWMENASLLLKYRHSERMTAAFNAAIVKDRPETTRKDVFNGHFEYTWGSLPGRAGRSRLTNWSRYKNPTYNETFPVPSLEDEPDRFHDTCQKMGIEFLVIRQGLLVPDAFERWMAYPGFEVLESMPQKKFMMSSHYEPLSKEIDQIHLIKVRN